MSATTPSSPGRHVRRRWSLQTRLITAVVGMVTLILAMIGLATSALLGNILSGQLDTQVRDAAGSVSAQLVGPHSDYGSVETALSVLQDARVRTPGVLLVVRSPTALDGAYLDGNTVNQLTDAQVQQIVTAFDTSPATTATVDDLGAYRLFTTRAGNNYVIAVGLPLSSISSTIAQILTTVALVTTGGLLLLILARLLDFGFDLFRLDGQALAFHVGGVQVRAQLLGLFDREALRAVAALQEQHTPGTQHHAGDQQHQPTRDATAAPGIAVGRGLEGGAFGAERHGEIPELREACTKRRAAWARGRETE